MCDAPESERSGGEGDWKEMRCGWRRGEHWANAVDGEKSICLMIRFLSCCRRRNSRDCQRSHEKQVGVLSVEVGEKRSLLMEFNGG